MRLLIPQHIAQERRQIPAAPMFGVYYGLSEVTGRRASPADLIQALGRYRRSDVIRWIAAVSSWIARDDGLEPGNQLGMADHLLCEDYRKGLRGTG